MVHWHEKVCVCVCVCVCVYVCACVCVCMCMCVGVGVHQSGTTQEEPQHTSIMYALNRGAATHVPHTGQTYHEVGCYERSLHL